MADDAPSAHPAVRGVAYPSFYFKDVDAAVALYEAVFGPCAYHEAGFHGLKLGDTWLTLFDPKMAPHPGENPANAEIALRLATPADVDALHATFVENGAKTVMQPQDTWMYENMRYACLDDPLGVRWDLYCPIEALSGGVTPA